MKDQELRLFREKGEEEKNQDRERLLAIKLLHEKKEIKDQEIRLFRKKDEEEKNREVIMTKLLHEKMEEVPLTGKN